MTTVSYHPHFCCSQPILWLYSSDDDMLLCIFYNQLQNNPLDLIFSDIQPPSEHLSLSYLPNIQEDFLYQTADNR